jgi:translation initiation factor 1
VITGLTLDQNALKKLAKTLKAQLGTGGAIKDGNIEIQGDHREKLVELLAKQNIKAKIAGG